MQAHWAVGTDETYGYWTTVNSAIATWAAIAGDQLARAAPSAGLAQADLQTCLGVRHPDGAAGVDVSAGFLRFPQRHGEGEATDPNRRERQ